MTYQKHICSSNLSRLAEAWIFIHAARLDEAGRSMVICSRGAARFSFLLFKLVEQLTEPHIIHVYQQPTLMID